MIVCNGASKTGTHLLLKAVYLFGSVGFTATHAHKKYGSKIYGKHIHIKRNPRNVLISWLRFTGQDLTDKNLLRNMPHVINEMNEYLGWLNDKDTLNVSFENLLTDEKEIKRISDFIEVPLSADHFRKLWGDTPTFTNSLSNWRESFSDKIKKEWGLMGGHELERLLGYAPDSESIKVRKV